MSTNTQLLKDKRINRMKICRLCGNKGVSHVPIFENKYFIAEKISRCLPIVIVNTDPWPLHICKKCFNLLNITYCFITRAVQVDEVLKMSTESPEDVVPPVNELELLNKVALAGPVDCDLCHCTFADLETFDLHMESEHLLLWRCDHCEQSYNTYEELSSHKSTHSVCIMRPEAIEHPEAILDHIDLPSSQVLKQSDVDIDMNDLEELEEERVPSTEDPEKENSIQNRSELNGHVQESNMNIDADDKFEPTSKGLDKLFNRVQCDFCPKTYISMHYLSNHMVRCHEGITSRRKINVNGEITYHCQICGETFPHQSNLTMHMSKHNKKKRLFSQKVVN